MSAESEVVRRQVLTAWRSGRLAHAYLIHGPGSAAEEAALAVAAVLLCEGHRGCGTCQGCRMTSRRVHPDLLDVRPGGKSSSIGVEQVREAIEFVARKSYLGGRKVVILHQADRMTPEAANAFLKTLEEPAGQTTLLLLTERASALPETVLSRCQMLRVTGETAAGRSRIAPEEKKRLWELLQAAVRQRDPIMAAAVAQRLVERAEELVESSGGEGTAGTGGGGRGERRRAVLALLEEICVNGDAGADSAGEGDSEWLQWVARVERLDLLLNRYVDERVALEDILLGD